MRVGFVGWRGMVGSVLLERMRTERDFDQIEPVFFSTSQVGQPAPEESSKDMLIDAFSIEELSSLDAIITCQGGDYTTKIHPQLRESGWDGYWIDAASALRMNDDAILVLDPVNRHIIDAGLAAGKKDLIGANCTVSPMLLGLAGLFATGEVEWVSSMTYQAASGAGARAMRELLQQMNMLGSRLNDELGDPSQSILSVDQSVNEVLAGNDFPVEMFGAPLAGNALPWIDAEVAGGQSREEWKGMVEANKILGTSGIAVDGTCVRIGAMRSHSLGLTVKLKRNIPLKDIESMIADAHEWVTLVPNNKQDTITTLTPAHASGSLQIFVGRVRKSKLGDEYLNAFIVADQLLWGAAEPLRRALLLINAS